MFLAFVYTKYIVAPAVAETSSALAQRASDTVWHYVAPVVNLASDTYERAVAGMRPLPEGQGASEAVWKYKSFPLFVLKKTVADEKTRQAELMAFFIDDAKRNSLENPSHNEFLHNYVLCALKQAKINPPTIEHTPILGLDLCVLYGLRTKYDDFVIEHYRSQPFGTHRDSLFSNALNLCNQNPAMEKELRATLDNTESLLYLTLKDHRLPLSYPALTGAKPETIKELKAVLDERINRRAAATALTKTTKPNF